jgi:hypothetical protein
MVALRKSLTLFLLAMLAVAAPALAQMELQPETPSGSVTDYHFQPLIHPSVSVDCTCIDLTFIIDDTGSMGGAINNVKLGLVDIINTANVVSCGDLRVGLITFKDDVTVHSPLTNNVGAVVAQTNALVASGGAGGPERTTRRCAKRSRRRARSAPAPAASTSTTGGAPAARSSSWSRTTCRPAATTPTRRAWTT